MAEYNKQYLDLSKRLRVLKLKRDGQPYDDLEILAKQLDKRYSENQFLDEIEVQIEKLEK